MFFTNLNPILEFSCDMQYCYSFLENIYFEFSSFVQLILRYERFDIQHVSNVIILNREQLWYWDSLNFEWQHFWEQMYVCSCGKDKSFKSLRIVLSLPNRFSQSELSVTSTWLLSANRTLLTAHKYHQQFGPSLSKLFLCLNTFYEAWFSWFWRNPQTFKLQINNLNIYCIIKVVKQIELSITMINTHINSSHHF